MPPATAAAVITLNDANANNSRARSPRLGRDVTTGSHRPEPVAEPTHRLHVDGRRRVILDLRAQPLHARVHQARVAEVPVLPHRLEQLLAAVYPPRRAGELEQQAQL